MPQALKNKTNRSKAVSKKGTSLGTLPKKELAIDIKVIECPAIDAHEGYYNFSFRFVGKCPIESCQYHTHTTEHSCLIKDTKLPSTTFSDPQLYHFKIQNNPRIPQDQKPKLRTVNLMRKKFTGAIKANVVYYYFISHIQDNFDPSDSAFFYRKGQNRFLDSVLRDFPFKQPGIDFFNYWMLPFLFDNEIYKSFLESDQNMQFASSDINLQSVLGLTPVKFIKTQTLIKQLSNPDFQKKIAGSLF